MLAEIKSCGGKRAGQEEDRQENRNLERGTNGAFACHAQAVCSQVQVEDRGAGDVGASPGR